MTDLPPELREAFAAARSHYDAEPARLARVREQVVLRAGAPAAGRVTAAAKLWLVIGVLGLVGAGASWWSARANTPSVQTQPRPIATEAQVGSAPMPASALPVVAAVRSAPLRTVQPPQPATPSEDVLADSTASEPEEPPAAQITRSRAPRPRPSPRAPSASAVVHVAPSSGQRIATTHAEPEPGESLLEEAGLIESARSALDAGDTARAARELRTHALRHPAGQLLVERVALRTLLACKLHDRDTARSAFAQLLLLRPPASLRLSIERTCGAWIAP